MSTEKLQQVPLVSISCITYNHENYIRDTIEGFLMQKTNFSFEILIHDDASTDKTADIIREYEKKHTDLIFPIYQTVNQYSKEIMISPKFNWPRARGKYMAICEGDDYWTDPYKLQKQVDFLERNEEYGLVHTEGDYHYVKNGSKIKNYILETCSINPNKIDNPYEAILRSEYSILTCSVVFRSEMLKELRFDEMSQFRMGDTFLWLEFIQKSKFHFFEENMITRNILIESASQSNSYENLLKFKKSGYELCKYFMKKYVTSDETKRIVHEKFNRVILNYAFLGNNKPEAKKAYEKLKSVNGKSIALKDKLFYFGSKNQIQRQLAFVFQYQLKIWKRIFLKR